MNTYDKRLARRSRKIRDGATPYVAYQRGRWQLVVEPMKAQIVQMDAFALVARHGVRSSQGLSVSLAAVDRWELDLSKKARKMLEAAGVKVE